MAKRERNILKRSLTLNPPARYYFGEAVQALLHFSSASAKQIKQTACCCCFIYHSIPFQFNSKKRWNEKWLKSFMQIESRISLYMTRYVCRREMWKMNDSVCVCACVRWQSETDSKTEVCTWEWRFSVDGKKPNKKRLAQKGPAFIHAKSTVKLNNRSTFMYWRKILFKNYAHSCPYDGWLCVRAGGFATAKEIYTRGSAFPAFKLAYIYILLYLSSLSHISCWTRKNNNVP